MCVGESARARERARLRKRERASGQELTLLLGMKIPWKEENEGPPATEEQYQERFWRRRLDGIGLGTVTKGFLAIEFKRTQDARSSYAERAIGVAQEQYRIDDDVFYLFFQKQQFRLLIWFPSGLSSQRVDVATYSVIQICRISRPIYSGIRKYRSRPMAWTPHVIFPPPQPNSQIITSALCIPSGSNKSIRVSSEPY